MGVWGQLCQQYHLFNGCLYRPSQVIHCPSELYLSDQCAWIQDGAKLLPQFLFKALPIDELKVPPTAIQFFWNHKVESHQYQHMVCTRTSPPWLHVTY